MSRVIHYSGQAPRVDPGRVQVTIDGAEHLLRGPLVEGEVVITLDGELHCASCRKKAAFQVERSHHPLAAWSFACCQCGTSIIVKRARPQVPKPLRTPCGFFSASVTSDPRQVTCRTCSRLVQPLLASTPTPTPKPEKPTMRTAISTALFYLTATLAAACGTPVAGLTTSDDSTSTTAVDSSSDPDLLTSSGPVTSGGEDASTSTSTSEPASTSVTSSPGAGTLDDAGIPPDDTSTSSTSDTTGTSSSSGGDTIDTSTGEDSTTTSEGGAGEPVVCYGDPCSAVGCAGDMTCVPSPPTGLAVCVTPCTPDEPCIIAAFVCDPDVGPHGVCKQDDTGMGWCFPK